MGRNVSVHPTLPSSSTDCPGAHWCPDPMWEDMPQVIRSMPRRCQECIQTQGAMHTAESHYEFDQPVIWVFLLWFLVWFWIQLSIRAVTTFRWQQIIHCTSVKIFNLNHLFIKIWLKRCLHIREQCIYWIYCSCTITLLRKKAITYCEHIEKR